MQLAICKPESPPVFPSILQQLKKVPPEHWQLPVSDVASDCGMLIAGRFLSTGSFINPDSESYRNFRYTYQTAGQGDLSEAITPEVRAVILGQLKARNKSVVIASLRMDSQQGAISILEALGFKKVHEYTGQYKAEPYMALYVLNLREVK